MDGDGTALMEKGCGTTLPANITTRSNIVNLMFSTDSSQTMTGWHVIWSASEYWYLCFQMITICYWLCKLYSLALCQIYFKATRYLIINCLLTGFPAPTLPFTCSTIGGPDPDSECKFPFIFGGVAYNECTTIAVFQPWCATQTDACGYLLTDGDGGFTNWGYCHPSCPITQGPKIWPLIMINDHL